jgi:aquaporin Z
MDDSHADAIGNVRKALANHWPEYAMEATELGMFMLSACLFVALFEYPRSPVRQVIDDPLVRRVFIAIAMGLTAIAIVYSPFGQRSGAHFNPAVTLTFLRLGKIAAWDAVFYMVAQFIGALSGVWLSLALLGPMVLADPSIEFVATIPGPWGASWALVAEIVISFILMTVILQVSNRPNLNRYTALFAGFLVAIFIAVEAPISGMSMNPARSFASAFPAHLWTALWIYFLAPPAGMLAAAEIYLRRSGRGVLCCKLHHENDKRCIFFCSYHRTSIDHAP